MNDKKVTFDDAMKMADDATGAVTAGVSLIPGVDVLLALVLTVGEELVTGIVEGAKAVDDEKHKNIKGETWTDKKGNKLLKPDVWL